MHLFLSGVCQVVWWGEPFPNGRQSNCSLQVCPAMSRFREVYIPHLTVVAQRFRLKELVDVSQGSNTRAVKLKM